MTTLHQTLYPNFATVQPGGPNRPINTRRVYGQSCLDHIAILELLGLPVVNKLPAQDILDAISKLTPQAIHDLDTRMEWIHGWAQNSLNSIQSNAEYAVEHRQAAFVYFARKYSA